MAKFYTETKEIKGVKYTAQFNGLSAALNCFDNSYVEGSGNTSILKLAEYIFENVIVEPKGLSVDDFDNMNDLNEVVRFGSDVMQGKFRTSADKGTTEGKSKK